MSYRLMKKINRLINNECNGCLLIMILIMSINTLSFVFEKLQEEI